MLSDASRALAHSRGQIVLIAGDADMLLFDARRMHEQVLATLEPLADAASHLDQLAYHAWVARDVPKTLAYNERAGEAALRMHGVPEARFYLERALSATSDPADEARLLERVGYVAQLQGRSSDTLDAYEATLALRLAREEYDCAAELVRAISVERNKSSVTIRTTRMRSSSANRFKTA